jgi:hypothetical protein
MHGPSTKVGLTEYSMPLRGLIGRCGGPAGLSPANDQRATLHLVSGGL